MPNLTEILTESQGDIDGDEITLEEIVARFEGRSFGPLLVAVGTGFLVCKLWPF